MKCCNCLHSGTIGDPVSFHTDKLGKPIALCNNETDCWARYDRSHGFENTPAIKEYAKQLIGVR